MHVTFLGIWGQEQGLVPLSTVLGMDMPQRGFPVWTGQFINTQHVKASFTSSESQHRQGAGQQLPKLEILCQELPCEVCVSVKPCGYPPVLIAQYFTEEETEAHRSQSADLRSGR